MSTTSSVPWLLYSYPWMPYPRRVQIYLAEKLIPSSAITVVHVSDPQDGNCVVPSQADKCPPRPDGSLPILAISQADGSWLHIKQSIAIMNYLEEACAPNGELAHLKAKELDNGRDALERARLQGILSLADELTSSWNPVRIFGSGAGTLVYPVGAKEMYRWVHRTLSTVNGLLANQNRDIAALAKDETAVSLGDIVLFQFLDFVDVCYGIDITKGSGDENVDVYGRVRKEEYPVVRVWYQAFKQRRSARRDGEGENAGPEILARMQYWHPGSL